MKRLYIIGFGVLIVAIVGVVAAALFIRKPTPTPPPVAISTPTARPTPSPRPTPPDPEVFARDEAEFQNRYPIISKLPHANRYWSIEPQEPEDDKLPLKVTVFHLARENADDTLERQKPFVERWVREHGGSDDDLLRYELFYETVEVTERS